MIDASSSLDQYIDQLEEEQYKFRLVLLEISQLKPVTDTVDAHSLSYAAQLASEAIYGPKEIRCPVNEEVTYSELATGNLNTTTKDPQKP
jgi:hypothetical protein